VDQPHHDAYLSHSFDTAGVLLSDSVLSTNRLLERSYQNITPVSTHYQAIVIAAHLTIKNRWIDYVTLSNLTRGSIMGGARGARSKGPEGSIHYPEGSIQYIGPAVRMSSSRNTESCTRTHCENELVT